MKAGFTLLEVLLAVAITAMLSIVLFSSFYQINRTVVSLDNTITTHMRLALAWRQLEKDIAGITIPIEAADELKKKEEPEQGKIEEKKEGAAEKKGDVAQEEPPRAKKTKPPLTKVFYGDTKDGLLNTLTFISNNPLQSYSDATTAGNIKPRIVRVVYRLVPDKLDKRGKQSYKLMRQESEKLDPELFKPGMTESIRSYELIGNIKDIKVSYLRMEKEEKESEKSKAKKEVKADRWDTDEQVAKLKAEQEEQKAQKGAQDKKKEEEKKQKGLSLPHMIEFSFGLWDHKKERPKFFTMRFALICDFDKDQQEQQEVKPEQKPEKKPEKEEDKKKEPEKTPAITIDAQVAVTQEPLVQTGNVDSAMVTELSLGGDPVSSEGFTEFAEKMFVNQEAVHDVAE